MCERNVIGPNFNEQVQPQNDAQRRDYSVDEVHQLMNNYKTLAERDEDQRFMKDLHQHYMESVGNQEVVNYAQQMEFNLGLDVGIQTEQGRERIIENHELRFQDIRNDIIRQAKEYYHPNYSMSKDFEEVSREDKEIDMDL